MKQEKETNYFLTVFERKPFGNEKIYEKRINSRGHTLNIEKMEIHPKGGFLFLGFKIDYTSCNLVFNISAQYKDPMLIKNGQLLCFDGSLVYTHARVVAKPRKEKETTMGKENEGDKGGEEDTANVEDEADAPDMRDGLK